MTGLTVVDPGAVTLHLGGTDDSELSLSDAVVVGSTLFLAPDEGAELVALTRDRRGDFCSPTRIPVRALVPAPGGVKDELDLEGIDHGDGALWIVGSHGGVRRKGGKKPEDVPANLAEMTFPASRQVLARLPLDGSEVLAGAMLPTGVGGLRDALRTDRHVGPFLDLPGKDNGLDVEGLVVSGPRVLLGLRGPVLRGWAVVLELEPLVVGDRLELGDPPVRTHFLDLGGLGCRDLAVVGDDLLVLAGPTMVLDGPARLVRVHDGAGNLPDVVSRDDVELLAEFPTGIREDHPEAIAVLEGATILVAYDSPSDARRTDDGGVWADVVTIVG